MEKEAAEHWFYAMVEKGCLAGAWVLFQRSTLSIRGL